MSLLSPQKVFFSDMQQGIKLFLCENNDIQFPQIIDTVTVDEVYPVKSRISVRNKNNKVIDFALIDEVGWVILEEDPFQPGQMTFSHRGPIYSFFRFC
jgi:hypothetical protein